MFGRKARPALYALSTNVQRLCAFSVLVSELLDTHLCYGQSFFEGVIVMPNAERLRDMEGEFPLAVVLWLDQHPTGTLALALGVSSPSVRWHYVFSGSLSVVVRGARVETWSRDGRERTGTARVHGTRSAGDFDALPLAPDDAPYQWPALAYPVTAGFACDKDGQVARFTAQNPGGFTPGLLAKFTQYPDETLDHRECIKRLAHGHTERTMAPSPKAFAAKTKDLIAALTSNDVVGPARVQARFIDDNVIVWPEPTAEFSANVLAALHRQRACLGCSRNDPRDVLSLGTWRYHQPRDGREDAFVRDAAPSHPFAIETLAAALGRSTAELAATQLNVRFAETLQITGRSVRLPA